MSRDEPLVSVVTPVYNGERYLSECIESVLAQDYPNWDYTIVNNCSTDRTAEIAETYAARDPRIRIRHNETFVRVVANYNNAVRQLSPDSTYCKVVAADDWLFPECLRRMVEVAERHPSIAIVGAYGIRGSKIVWDGLPYSNTKVDGRGVCRSHLLGGPYPFGTPSSVLYRSQVIRTSIPFYNESNLHADVEVCLAVLKDWDFGFVHQVLVFVRTDDSSLSSFSQRLSTNQPAMLGYVRKYGPIYLSSAEARHREAELLDRYYSMLCESIVHRRGKEFWTYHRNKLAALGLPLDYRRLATKMAARLADVLLNPKRTVEGVWRLLREWAKRVT
jgi:glycosyltransferase involved in cell wall biosynthesis